MIHCIKSILSTLECIINSLLNFGTSLVLKYCLKYFTQYLSTLSFSTIVLVLVLNIATNVLVKYLITFKRNITHVCYSVCYSLPSCLCFLVVLGIVSWGQSERLDNWLGLQSTDTISLSNLCGKKYHILSNAHISPSFLSPSLPLSLSLQFTFASLGFWVKKTWKWLQQYTKDTLCNGTIYERTLGEGFSLPF